MKFIIDEETRAELLTLAELAGSSDYFFTGDTVSMAQILNLVILAINRNKT